MIFIGIRRSPHPLKNQIIARSAIDLTFLSTQGIFKYIELEYIMFSQSSEYALRAVILLALTDGRRGGQDIARELDIPANYLSKLLQQLCRHGILSSRKGWGGGYQLAKKPYKISVGDIVEPFEGSSGPRECILGKDRCTDENPCPLHGYWKQIKSIHEVMTSRVTVADLVQSAKMQSR